MATALADPPTEHDESRGLGGDSPPREPPITGHVRPFRLPDNVCHSCEAFWKERGKEPRILVELPERCDFGTRVYVCPHCDGPVADNVAS